MKKPAQHPIDEVPRRQAKVEMTIGIDLGDVWSHYCTLNQDGEVVDRGRFRTTPKAIEKWFTDVPPARVAMEAGVHSIWISAQLQELGHEVIVANVRELRAISHSDRKSDQVDAEKLARYARLDPNILRPIAHRTVQQQEALTLVRASALARLTAPMCQIIQKSTDSFSRPVAQFVFDMKGEIAHVFSDDDSVCFQLAQILSQHLLGCPRNEPCKLAQAHRSRSHRTKDMDSPLALEKYASSKCSVAHILCVQVRSHRKVSPREFVFIWPL